jgi:hypothetical protein
MYSQDVNAAAGTPLTAGGSLTSAGVGVGVVAAGNATVIAGGATDSWWAIGVGILVDIGGIAIVAADPPPAIFYSGDYTFHYDGGLLQLNQTAWLGDWGEDPSLLAPPANWGAGSTFALQNPSSALSTTTINDASAGLLNVSFSWGDAGHPSPGLEPFNFFASIFQAKQKIMIEYLGKADTPIPGSNFYSSSSGIYCKPSGIDIIQKCGEPVTDYFKVSSVPEPASWAMLIVGFALVGIRCAGARRSRPLTGRPTEQRRTLSETSA